MFASVKNRLISVIAPDMPQLPSPPDQSYSQRGGSGNQSRISQKQHMPRKFAYARPPFLQLLTPDELRASADHNVRPIIVPRDITLLPWGTGYAECVNSGKSEWNEDQAAFCRQVLSDPTHKHSDLPYTYYGIFDGHAGYGAALAASHQFHHILHEKLVDCIDMLLPRDEDHSGGGAGQLSSDGFPHPSLFQRHVNKDELIIGALESAFFHMDSLIAQDRDYYRDAGGCTACVSLFICGKMYVANAGDSRAVLCQRKAAAATASNEQTEMKEKSDAAGVEEDTLGSYPVPFSVDHTPETERDRLLNVALLNPNLLGKYYAAMEYAKRPLATDLGQRILCRQGAMKGWTYKTLTRDDLRMPVVTGEGKRSRLLRTLGVTRGFGDHDLLAIYTGTQIKPFLTPHPDVNHRDLSKIVSIPGENNEDGDYGILVIASDGLWDVSENEAVARTVFQTLAKYPTEKYRYTMVAQELVAKARGKINDSGHWRLADSKAAATVDDISVIVIPVYQYYKEHIEWEKKCAQEAQERAQAEADEESAAKKALHQYYEKYAPNEQEHQATEAREDGEQTMHVNGLIGAQGQMDNDEDEEEIVVELNRQQVQAHVEEEEEPASKETSALLAAAGSAIRITASEQSQTADVAAAEDAVDTQLSAATQDLEHTEISTPDTTEETFPETPEKAHHKSKHHHHQQQHHHHQQQQQQRKGNRKEKH